MGVPAFYRCLVEKYPMAVVEEETVVMIEGVKFPVDTSKPKPNGLEYGKLYGTIHPCLHREH